MGRAPCCEKDGVRKGAWSSEEDEILIQYINKHGHGSWRSLPKHAGLLRCGKSCRLRWTNYLRPDIKRGPFSSEEEATIIQLHGLLGNRWAAIASQLPGRTDNEVKNFWNTHLKKQLLSKGQNLVSNRSTSSKPNDALAESTSTRHMVQWESARLEAEARLSMESSLLNPMPTGRTDCDYFLKLWNSEVGESFRKPKGKDGMLYQGCSQTSSSNVKVGSPAILEAKNTTTSTSYGTYHALKHAENHNQTVERDYLTETSDSSSTYELEDPSDAAMKMLLDFPTGDDMGFL